MVDHDILAQQQRLVLDKRRQPILLHSFKAYGLANSMTIQHSAFIYCCRVAAELRMSHVVPYQLLRSSNGIRSSAAGRYIDLFVCEIYFYYNTSVILRRLFSARVTEMDRRKQKEKKNKQIKQCIMGLSLFFFSVLFHYYHYYIVFRLRKQLFAVFITHIDSWNMEQCVCMEIAHGHGSAVFHSHAHALLHRILVMRAHRVVCARLDY